MTPNSMGAIEEVYEELDDDVEFEEFEAAVHEKVEQMGGLADEETAAKLVAHELDDGGGEVDSIADIDAGLEEVKFLGKVVSVGDLRTFERDGEDEDGRVINVEVADGSGRIRITFWDERAVAVDEGELGTGDVLRIAGRPKEGYDGVEINVDRAEVDEDAEVDAQVLDTYRVEDLALGRSDVTLEGRVLDTDSIRTFDRDDGSEGRVSNLVVGDSTGRVRVTLWDDRADLVEAFEPGDCIEVIDGYVRERDGDLELHVGDRGAIEEIDREIEYVPEAADIGDLEIGQTVDIAGGVIETDSKRTFDRDDGSEGQVRNVRIKDDTGEIRVALWGEKADAEIELADRVVVTDVEIEDGWQDDLEASANWRSTVTVLEDGGAGSSAGGDVGNAAAAGTTESGGAGGTAEGDAGLDAFADDGPIQGGTGDGATAIAAAEDDVGDGSDEDAESGPTEFTGTVVQAGDPVVLDNGQETRSVETDADLRLGEEVTVRGSLRDGRIDAEEIL